MFLKALECEADVVPKAMVNLGLLFNTRGSFMAQTGDMSGAKAAADKAARFLDEAKSLLDTLAANGKVDDQLGKYIQQYRPLRLQTYRLVGQLFAGAGDLASCEAEFRRAAEQFPDDAFAWQMLNRVLEMQGKHEDAAAALETAKSLMR